MGAASLEPGPSKPEKERNAEGNGLNSDHYTRPGEFDNRKVDWKAKDKVLK
jgi:hypothetical protein